MRSPSTTTALASATALILGLAGCGGGSGATSAAGASASASATVELSDTRPATLAQACTTYQAVLYTFQGDYAVAGEPKEQLPVVAGFRSELSTIAADLAQGTGDADKQQLQTHISSLSGDMGDLSTLLQQDNTMDAEAMFAGLIHFDEGMISSDC